ncbi:BID domain-containing protein, partial [uncultured Methylobacterium sp.]|uniref:BID domain-containing protein n=1 Tax=uncultured Methylobacterium sp. TaxID=157278 RepID=UPI0025931F58
AHTSASPALLALEKALDRLEHAEQDTADRVRPQDLRALASAFAERRGLNGHAVLVPALVKRARTMIVTAQTRWRRLHGVAARLAAAWQAVAATRPVAVATATSAEPLKPFLAAVPYDQAAIDASLSSRVDPERDLKRELDMLGYETRLAVNDPDSLFNAIYAQLRTPGKGYTARISALLADPGAYGGLRGRTGWFVPKAAKEERERAERAYDGIKRTAIDLKNLFSRAADEARPGEERYRRRIAIEVPGLSPAAAAALLTIARTPGTDPRAFDAVVVKAVATSEHRAEIEAFAEAVARRFSASGAIGRTTDKGLGPSQWLTNEEREILSGGGFVASYLKEGSLDHLIAKVLRRELDQRLDVKPQQVADERQELDRERDPGPTL